MTKSPRRAESKSMSGSWCNRAAIPTNCSEVLIYTTCYDKRTNVGTRSGWVAVFCAVMLLACSVRRRQRDMRLKVPAASGASINLKNLVRRFAFCCWSLLRVTRKIFDGERANNFSRRRRANTQRVNNQKRVTTGRSSKKSKCFCRVDKKSFWICSWSLPSAHACANIPNPQVNSLHTSGGRTSAPYSSTILEKAWAHFEKLCFVPLPSQTSKIYMQPGEIEGGLGVPAGAPINKYNLSKNTARPFPTNLCILCV